MAMIKSILLLFVMGIMLFPWQLICTTHPFGHDHHEHDGPSPCELRKQYKGTDTVFWPPMDCKDISAQFINCQLPKTDKIKPTLQLIATILFDLHVLPEYETNFIQLPEARSNSDPPFKSISDRGPPNFC